MPIASNSNRPLPSKTPSPLRLIGICVRTDKELDIQIVGKTGGFRLAAIKAKLRVIPDTIPRSPQMIMLINRCFPYFVKYSEKAFQKLFMISTFLHIDGANLKTIQTNPPDNKADAVVRRIM